jgi:hypothetical protein
MNSTRYTRACVYVCIALALLASVQTKCEAERFVIGAYYRPLPDGRRYPGGFFSTFFAVLASLVWCDNNGRKPVVYWDDASLFYQASGYDGATNVWEYYFLPVSDEHYHEGDTLHHEYCAPDGVGIIPFRNFGRASREFMHHYVQKYIHIKPRIVAIVDAFYQQHIAGRYTVGIHLRGTDKRDEYLTPSIELFCAAAQRIADMHENAQFFIATDDAALLEQARALLRGPIVTYDSFKSPNGFPLHFLPAKNGKARLGEEVLIDALLLSRCNHMIHSSSNVSIAATFFNPEIEDTFLEGEKVR